MTMTGLLELECSIEWKKNGLKKYTKKIKIVKWPFGNIKRNMKLSEFNTT